MNSPENLTTSKANSLSESSLGEELVAYLDGELDVERRRSVEEHLSTNSDLRKKLKELQQAWDLLDELPRDHVDDSFARSTVEMVAIQMESEIEEKTRRAARWRIIAWVTALSLVLLACGAGFWVTYSNLSRENRQVVRDLPILENLDAYQNVGSIDFLRSLEKEGLFRDEESDAP